MTHPFNWLKLSTALCLIRIHPAVGECENNQQPTLQWAHSKQFPTCKVSARKGYLQIEQRRGKHVEDKGEIHELCKMGGNTVCGVCVAGKVIESVFLVGIA